MAKIKLELELECEVNEISLCSPMSICSSVSVSVSPIARGISIAHAQLSDRSYEILKEISNLRASTIIEDNSN